MLPEAAHRPALRGDLRQRARQSHARAVARRRVHRGVHHPLLKLENTSTELKPLSFHAVYAVKGLMHNVLDEAMHLLLRVHLLLPQELLPPHS